jgi:hypothetical protein
VGWSGERRLAAGSRAHGRRAARPAAARELSPVRRACSADPDERSVPGAHPCAPRYRDGPCRHPRASRAQCPRSSDRTTVALARPATVASDRGGARLQCRPDRRAARLRHRPPSWRRRSGNWPTLPLNAATAVTSRCHRPPSFGRGPRPSSESAACRAAWRESFRRSPRSPAQPRPLANARPRRPALRTCAWAQASQKPPSCYPMRKLLPPQWGQFRTVNWTLNAENRPQPSERAPGRAAINRRLAGKT